MDFTWDRRWFTVYRHTITHVRNIALPNAHNDGHSLFLTANSRVVQASTTTHVSSVYMEVALIFMYKSISVTTNAPPSSAGLMMMHILFWSSGHHGMNAFTCCKLLHAPETKRQVKVSGINFNIPLQLVSAACCQLDWCCIITMSIGNADF